MGLALVLGGAIAFVLFLVGTLIQRDSAREEVRSESRRMEAGLIQHFNQAGTKLTEQFTIEFRRLSERINRLESYVSDRIRVTEETVEDVAEDLDKLAVAVGAKRYYKPAVEAEEGFAVTKSGRRDA